MPEKPEVITVVEVLKRHVLGKKITSCHVFWDAIIAYPEKEDFEKLICNQTIQGITSRGKWIVIELDRDFLLVHLRMEGKFFFRTPNDPKNKHEHVIFGLSDGLEMRFADVRKFGRMHLICKTEIRKMGPLLALGYEFDDPALTGEYLFACFQSRRLPIKTVLLDQSIIAGIGNIYDDEILFLSKISPLTRACDIPRKKCYEIVANTRKVLKKAISLGGTTIRSYTSYEGVHGRFQNELLVHGKKNEACPICGNRIEKIYVGGRGTYYCPKCQKRSSIVLDHEK